ncbi:MAG TPA: CNNM domain-containing protein [Pseudolabrys sp.]|nr:CNNM domain-containing protein [Pseudolabrys sp.]
MLPFESLWIWLGIIACVVQTGLFAGLNLAVFSLSHLRLQIEADAHNPDAAQVLALRKHSNQVLATIVWGNVSTNVVLTLLSDSVLAGIGAFVFSTVAITLLGDIIPQAYFSRNALRMATRFLPFLQFCLVVLYPVAKPTALVLDWWLGQEGITLLRERDVHALIARSVGSGGDIGKVEAIGAENFLDLDDVPVSEEGEPLHPQSIISLPLDCGRCVLPKFERSPDDPFLRKVDASGKKWVIVTDPAGEPVFVLDSHHFLRDALLGELKHDDTAYWHRPIIIRDLNTRLGEVISQLRVQAERPGDDVIDHDLILVWCGAQRRIITGSDLLGRLMRNIAIVEKPVPPAPREPPISVALS